MTDADETAELRRRLASLEQRLTELTQRVEEIEAGDGGRPPAFHMQDEEPTV